jgi:hypothetical protein
MDIKNFLWWEIASHDTIDFKKVYVDMADDLVAGLLLSQIVYWHLPSKDTQESKLKVFREGHFWIAKGREDWKEEIRISPKQFDRAIKILENKDIVVVKIFKFNEAPRKHVRLNWNHFLAFLEHQLEVNASKKIDAQAYSDLVINQRVNSILPKGENGAESFNDMDFTQRSKRILPKGENESSPKGNMDFTRRSITSYTENTHKDNYKEIIVNKVILLDIFNSYYSSCAPGRWSKEQWKNIADKLTSELLDDDGIFRKSKNPDLYIKGCLENIIHHKDSKAGRKKFKYEGTEIPWYDWTQE